MGLISDVIGQATAPLKDGVSAISDALHGNFKDALEKGAEAVGNGVMDASMIVAPEAAPEELALKTGGEALFKDGGKDVLSKSGDLASLTSSSSNSDQSSATT